ncbi:MAG: FecR family protein [Myxococcota bacterium]
MNGRLRWGFALALIGGSVISSTAKAGEFSNEARLVWSQGTVEILPKEMLRRVAHTENRAPSTRAKWQRLRASMRVRAGDSLRTGPSSRAELSLGDGSVIRIGAETTLTVERADFTAQGQRNVSMHVWLGRLWASVAKRLNGTSSFEVRTRNAVAGVRGTSFAVIAQADLSSIVKVYTGTVGVKKKGTSKLQTARVRTSGPEQIDQKQWEEVIATARRQVVVTQLGEIRPAEDFVDKGADQAWANWNQERDRQR